ncbi:MAG: ComF family protein [Gammaproteobacteria bacterium]|nr:ComF family protein [Gammaproteobacteria bacterium]MDH5799599.1 ComF family protein [Gammaproteobacteria bacterium]
MNNWIITDHILRGTCLLCEAPGLPGRDLCAPCYAELPISAHRCPVCALPLPGLSNTLCGHCIKTKPAFDQCVTVFDYGHPLDFLIRRFKYHQNLACGRLLAQLFLAAVHRKNSQFLCPPPQLIVPVPLHPQRLRQRGFNQALELGRVLSRSLGIPLQQHIVERVLHTEPQSSMSAIKRKTNLKQAFRVRSTLLQQLPKQHIAIVDDVLTTGSTANALAHSLKNHGVTQVSVWVLARAP